MLGACVSQSTCEKQTAGLQQARAQEAAEQGQINKMRRSRNGSSPVTYCFLRASISSVPMANRHSTNTSPAAGPAERKLHLSPPLRILTPLAGGREGWGLPAPADNAMEVDPCHDCGRDRRRPAAAGGSITSPHDAAASCAIIFCIAAGD